MPIITGGGAGPKTMSISAEELRAVREKAESKIKNIEETGSEGGHLTELPEIKKKEQGSELKAEIKKQLIGLNPTTDELILMKEVVLAIGGSDSDLPTGVRERIAPELERRQYPYNDKPKVK